MLREQFIDWLLVKFMSNADDEQAESQVKDFERILPTDIDFDYLYEQILRNYDKRSIPTFKDIEPYFKYNKPINSLYWTATIKTELGNFEYDFAIEMNKTEDEVIKAAHKKGWQYIRGNRRQVLLDNGLA